MSRNSFISGMLGKMIGENGKNGLEEPLLGDSGSVVVSIPEAAHISDEKVRSISFKVNGITCASCAISIETALGSLNGIRSVMVSPLQGQAVVKYIPELITVRQLTSCFFVLYFNQVC